MTFTRLTVFLLRDGLSSAVEAIRDDKMTTEVTASEASGIDGSFFYQHSSAHPPSWVPEVDAVLSQDITGVVSASASGVFVLRTSSRWFAISFGYGRSLLDLTVVVRKFGMRVGLNLVEPTQLRSMDTKTFEDLVVTKNTQASKNSDLPAFGIDISKDILRAVAGIPRDRKFGTRLAGSDSITLVRKASAADLPVICDELLIAYNADDYKENFAWIDQLAVVEDVALLDTLNDMLVTALRAGDTSSTYMAAPDSLDWEDVDAFTITGTYRQEYGDLDLDAYLANLKPKQTATLCLKDLQQREVTVRYSRSGNTLKLWNIYQCLISEQQIGTQLYVLIEGNWFAVDKTLSEQVDHFYAGLDTATTLEDAAPDETEPAYNLRMAAEHPNDYLHLDAKIVRPGGASSGIEFCDLLSKDGDLIHVKRKSRSSTLSHLFAQGSISATSLVGDGPFRDEVRKVIQDQLAGVDPDPWLDLIPPSTATQIDATKFNVSYVVLTKPLSGTSDWMPFFSKLNLMQHARQLQNMRFNVSISRRDN